MQLLVGGNAVERGVVELCEQRLRAVPGLQPPVRIDALEERTRRRAPAVPEVAGDQVELLAELHVLGGRLCHGRVIMAKSGVRIPQKLVMIAPHSDSATVPAGPVWACAELRGPVKEMSSVANLSPHAGQAPASRRGVSRRSHRARDRRLGARGAARLLLARRSSSRARRPSGRRSRRATARSSASRSASPTARSPRSSGRFFQWLVCNGPHGGGKQRPTGGLPDEGGPCPGAVIVKPKSRIQSDPNANFYTVRPEDAGKYIQVEVIAVNHDCGDLDSRTGKQECRYSEGHGWSTTFGPIGGTAQPPAAPPPPPPPPPSRPPTRRCPRSRATTRTWRR